jgi:hypothetical protein
MRLSAILLAFASSLVATSIAAVDAVSLTVSHGVLCAFARKLGCLWCLSQRRKGRQAGLRRERDVVENCTAEQDCLSNSVEKHGWASDT